MDRPRAWLLFKIWLLVAAVRLSLWLRSFAATQRWCSALGRSKRARQGAADPDQLASVVLRASRWFPGAGHCLTQALVASILLERRGFDAKIHFGVHSDEPELSAHAWVESDGAVVIGGDADLASYTQLHPPDTSASS